jgi:hypothetical protein
MIMRLISALVCWCFTFNVLASTGVAEEFESTLNEYHYSMTVTWDQNDAQYAEKATAAFYENVSFLMERGLTQNEILDIVSKKMTNSNEMQALKTKLEAMAKSAHSTNELAKIISENSKNFYSSGASWNGSTAVMVGVGVVVVALIGYSIWFDATHTCVAYSYGTRCGWTSSYYGGPQFYNCWPTTYCSQYVKN